MNKLEDITNVSMKVIENTSKVLDYLIDKPDMFPTNCNSIQLEYENPYFEIEIKEDNIEVFFEEKEYSFSYDELYKVINMVKIRKNKPKKSVLFTGAFNPPTIAHEHMIESALNNGDFDYVIFAISNQRFLDKKQAKLNDYAYSEKDRLNMILEMTKFYPNVLVFGVEEGYTYDVLKAVKDFYNLEELYFALGSDKLEEIGRWGRHNLLLTEFCFYVLKRKDSLEYIESKCKELFKDTKYCIGTDNQKYKDISATLVRNLIKENKDFKDYVSKNVYKYLKSV